MRLKKITAITLVVMLALGMLMTPAAAQQAEAAGNLVYTDNRVSSIPMVNIQTPQNTVRLYAGLSWEALEKNIGVRLIVSEATRGPVAKSVLDYAAALLGAVEVKTIDMKLEKYDEKSGWTQPVKGTADRLRVCIALPVGSDPAKDYAVISLKEEGAYEVLGDLDPNPATITVDTDYFDAYMIIAAPAGTFNHYRVASPRALDKLEIPHYVKQVPSAISTAVYDNGVYSIGIITDTATTLAAIGGTGAYVEFRGTQPGKNAVAVMEKAVKNTNAIREKIEEDGKIKEKGLHYYSVDLRNQKGEAVIQTNGKLRITMTAPYGIPAYADYAVAVLNKDASVTILKDIDIDAGTITFDTDQFRLFAFLWGKKGAFDNIR